ncbi:MAG: PEP-CTERM sorting domain-containing protein [Sedimentisphaerales bacterium]|nr:PEP-CTERM sorting domain-containing protein [Sedimentisphaerales bacterium]
MKTKIITLALVTCCWACLNQAQAVPITIEITGEVTNFSDGTGLLNTIHVGSIFSGSYTYDTSTPDTNPALDLGDYFHYNTPCGIDLTVGGFVFKTDPNNIKLLVEVSNNYSYQDNYLVRSYNNLFLYNGVDVDHISWQLDDYSGTALSSTALPTTAPVLSDWDYNNLIISGGIGGTPPCYEKTFAISAEVTSVVLIPEPMSLFLFGLGGLLIRKRS